MIGTHASGVLFEKSIRVACLKRGLGCLALCVRPYFVRASATFICGFFQMQKHARSKCALTRYI